MEKPTLEDPQTDEQLKGIIVIIDSVAYDDEGGEYSVTKVYRGDLEGNIEEFIGKLEKIKQIVHFDPMKNFDPTTK